MSERTKGYGRICKSSLEQSYPPRPHRRSDHAAAGDTCLALWATSSTLSQPRRHVFVRCGHGAVAAAMTYPTGLTFFGLGVTIAGSTLWHNIPGRASTPRLGAPPDKLCYSPV